MKILDPGTQQLSNAEVLVHFEHLRQLQATREDEARTNGHTVTTWSKGLTHCIDEVTFNLTTAPSPLAPDASEDDTTAATTSHVEKIQTLITRLKPYGLAKPELLQILNHRPHDAAMLELLVEECEVRYPDEKTRDSMLEIIAEVLGRPPDGEEEGDEG